MIEHKLHGRQVFDKSYQNLIGTQMKVFDIFDAKESIFTPTITSRIYILCERHTLSLLQLLTKFEGKST